MGTLYFISDLHLSDERSDLIRAFQLFVDSLIKEKTEKRIESTLYILGDFYDSWIGDDNQPHWIKDIEASLKALVKNGVTVIVFHGNRDFLLDSSWAKKLGLTLITDHLVIQHHVNILLSHGDEACLDDIEYQSFRNMVRKPDWQQNFLALPLAERLSIAQNLRSKSKSMKSNKELNIMDVNQIEINRLMSSFVCPLMIHGHTHRPNLHQEQHGYRLVLGDWHTHAWFGVLKDNMLQQFKIALDTLPDTPTDMHWLLKNSTLAQKLDLTSVHNV